MFGRGAEIGRGPRTIHRSNSCCWELEFLYQEQTTPFGCFFISSLPDTSPSTTQSVSYHSFLFTHKHPTDPWSLLRSHWSSCCHLLSRDNMVLGSCLGPKPQRGTLEWPYPHLQLPAKQSEQDDEQQSWEGGTALCLAAPPSEEAAAQRVPSCVAWKIVRDW